KGRVPQAVEGLDGEVRGKALLQLLFNSHVERECDCGGSDVRGGKLDGGSLCAAGEGRHHKRLRLPFHCCDDCLLFFCRDKCHFLYSFFERAATALSRYQIAFERSSAALALLFFPALAMYL